MLLGWLVMARYVLRDIPEDGDLHVPKEVGDAWIACGWQGLDADGDMVITPAGLAASDLAAPEWGVNPVWLENCNG